MIWIDSAKLRSPYVGSWRNFSWVSWAEELPEDAQVLAFLLGECKFRSTSVPVERIVYHLVPDDDRWLLKLQGEQDGEKFGRKEDGVKVGDFSVDKTKRASQRR